MRKSFLILICLILSSCFNKENEHNKDSEIESQKNISKALDSCVFILHSKGFLDSLSLYEISKVKNIFSESNQAKYLYLSSVLALKNKNYNTALYLSFKVDSILQINNYKNDSLGVSVLLLTSQLYFLQSNSPKALTTALKSLELAKTSSLKQKCHFYIANSYLSINDNKNALLYYQKAEYNNRDSLFLVSLYNNMALCYNEMRLRSKQREYLLKAVKIGERGYNKESYSDALLNTMRYYYIEEKDDSAKIYMDRCLILDSLNLSAYSYDMFGDLLIALKQYDKAESYIRKAIFLYKEDSLYTSLAPAFKSLSNIKYAQKAYLKSIELLDSAYWHSRKYDKKVVIEETKKIEENYSIKLKAEEIRFLENENKSKEKEVRNRTYIFVISFFSLLFIGYILFRQRLLKKKIEKTKVEQQLFRLQMNPHFIFNAIAGIRGNILNDEKEQAVNYLGKFSKLLRKLLENSNKEWVSIEEEQAFLENYLSIQQVRYNHKFQFSISISNSVDVKSTLIPAMILQPFIENSIEHGFYNINYIGQLNVYIDVLNNEMLKVIIKDNGIGFMDNVNKSITESKPKSMSMDIVKKRLDIIGKETKTNSTFFITKKDGVTITLLIAFLKH